MFTSDEQISPPSFKWSWKVSKFCINEFPRQNSWKEYHKSPKIGPGAYIFQSPFLRGYIRRGLSTEGKLRFKIDWASLLVGRKFTVFALFYFVFEGNFPSTSPRGAYIRRGDLTEGFLRYEFGGLVHGGAYFRNFTVFTPKECKCKEFCLQTRLGGEICSSDVIMHKGQLSKASVSKRG